MASIEGLIHDWNEQGTVPAPQRPIQFDDETLRDGLQSPTVRDPGLDDKFELLEQGMKSGEPGHPQLVAMGKIKELLIRLKSAPSAAPVAAPSAAPLTASD